MLRFILGLGIDASFTYQALTNPKRAFLPIYHHDGPGGVMLSGFVCYGFALAVFGLVYIGIEIIFEIGLPIPYWSEKADLAFLIFLVCVPFFCMFCVFLMQIWRFHHITPRDRRWRKKHGAEFIPERQWNKYHMCFYCWMKDGKPGDFYEWTARRLRRGGKMCPRKYHWYDFKE